MTYLLLTKLRPLMYATVLRQCEMFVFSVKRFRLRFKTMTYDILYDITKKLIGGHGTRRQRRVQT